MKPIDRKDMKYAGSLEVRVRFRWYFRSFAEHHARQRAGELRFILESQSQRPLKIFAQPHRECDHAIPLIMRFHQNRIVLANRGGEMNPPSLQPGPPIKRTGIPHRWGHAQKG